jgi:hypothetical protein
MATVLVEQFIASHLTPPQCLVLDVDTTDDPVHGHQEGRFFHGYYDAYCFLSLYVFCGEQLLVAYLRHPPRKGDYRCLAGRTAIISSRTSAHLVLDHSRDGLDRKGLGFHRFSVEEGRRLTPAPGQRQ